MSSPPFLRFERNSAVILARPAAATKGQSKIA